MARQAWNKGLKVSGMSGKKQTPEHKEKIRLANIGKKRTEESREKMRQAKLLNPTSYWLGRKRYPETIAKLSERFRGERSNLWAGGISGTPYGKEWCKSLTARIRDRDGYKCAICLSVQGDITYHVHHIDYDKLNCDEANLITLCPSCHIKTNHNRGRWKAFFASEETDG